MRASPSISDVGDNSFSSGNASVDGCLMLKSGATSGQSIKPQADAEL